MDGYGCRLDCQPYLGGALETKMLLETLPLRKDKLHTLTAGFDGGIYNGPKFPRTYVESLEFGVPFLGGSSMLRADLSDLSLLSRKQAESRLLRHLELKPGMSLISCSGTIGRMVYVRNDMAGMWSSQHILKIVPNPSRIASGYLYAYLNSRFGIPLVVSGTYGSIIQSIGPAHIVDLPVPRLGDVLESQIHCLIENAANLRTIAIDRKREAVTAFLRLCSIPLAHPIDSYPRPLIGFAMSHQLSQRMDGTFFIDPCAEARSAFDAAGERCDSKSLGEISEVFIPTIFKRIYAGDPEQGFPYITGADVFCVQPKSDQYLKRAVSHEHRLLLEYGMIVIHEAGQRYGLLGRSVMVGRTLSGFACTNNMVRLVPHDPDDAGYIFAALSSEYGLRLLKREAAGSSIPHLDAARVAAIRIPWPTEQVRSEIAALAHEARESWDRADELEKEADAVLVNSLTMTTD
jgi:type I restriction enzyme S subunit